MTELALFLLVDAGRGKLKLLGLEEVQSRHGDMRVLEPGGRLVTRGRAKFNNGGVIEGKVERGDVADLVVSFVGIRVDVKAKDVASLTGFVGLCRALLPVDLGAGPGVGHGSTSPPLCAEPMEYAPHRWQMTDRGLMSANNGDKVLTQGVSAKRAGIHGRTRTCVPPWLAGSA